MAATIPHKFNIVFGTSNFDDIGQCLIFASILKMATGRNCSMSGINSGHHNLPTYEITNSTLSDFNDISYVGRLWCPELIPDIEKFLAVAIFKNGCHNTAQIQHCPISYVGRLSIRDIIIYPYIKFWWYRKMLNFYRPYFMPCFGSHCENGRHFENAELLL
jgi:hypothetical protein